MPVAEFEWDEEQGAANHRKHGVDFADAALVLEDDLGLTMADQSSEAGSDSLPSEPSLVGGCWWQSTPGAGRESA
jgi:hypothetical protein